MTSNLHDVKVLDPETMTIPEDAVRMQLNYRNIRAEGYARLRVGLDCESMAIAGKILSGAHVDTKVWHEQVNLHVGAPT